MAISSQSFVALRLHSSSNITGSLKQSVNLKSVFKNEVSCFLQNPSSNRIEHIDKLECAQLDNLGKAAVVTDVFDLQPDRGSGGGGENGKFPPGNGGGGGGDNGDGGGEEDDHDEEEFGPVMKFDEVMEEAEARGVSLPSDMLEAAKATGLRKLVLTRYLDLQGSSWGLGLLMKSCAMLRNRMLADPSFLCKVGTEIVIDSCCATFAEVQKRGKDFWTEFDLYAADLLVGIVVDIALVGMLAPYARIGKQSVASGGLFSGIKNSVAALPSSVFEAERPGCRFSAQQRLATYFYKGILYGSVGFGCGIIGQGIANMIMTAKRSMNKLVENVPVPPLVKSAALWGVFLAVSSNTRYQICVGVYSGRAFCQKHGGMQFVDWARWSGVQ